MAKKEMLISVCDRCDKETMQETASFKKGEILLPVGWITVSIRSRHTDLVSMDLCETCAVPALNAVSEGKR